MVLVLPALELVMAPPCPPPAPLLAFGPWHLPAEAVPAPASALTSVDLPALDRPRRHTSGTRVLGGRLRKRGAANRKRRRNGGCGGRVRMSVAAAREDGAGGGAGVAVWSGRLDGLGRKERGVGVGLSDGGGVCLVWGVYSRCDVVEMYRC